LREVVRARAVRLYVRGGTSEIDAAVSTGSVLDAARAAHLTQTIGIQDVATASELVDAARELEMREVQLRSQREEMERTVASLVPLRELLDKRLNYATDAYDKVKAALALVGKVPDVATGAQVCPVRGFVVFTDDFGQPRDGGHVHEGIDMPAREGTPVVAVVDGLMSHDVSESGGNGIWLMGTDDIAYYYAHLSRYEGDNRPVKAGDVIGEVGTTGVSTGPHLHFEVHPQHGAAVDGFPLLLGLCAEETHAPRG
jgi:murein DD-endopeptidase MepM/ murein hydrolase activator NlpD